MEDQYVRIAKIFKAMADPKRVQIVDLLSDGEVCVCVLLEHFQVSQPTLSHDLKLLMEVGIVKSRREGKRVLYSLNLDTLERLQRRLKKMLLMENDGGPAGE